MNREILFRGKRVDNGEWVYGAFVPDALEMLKGARGLDGFIRRCNAESGEVEMFEVDRETVGRFTGLTDKNGWKIFEWDIVRHVESGKNGRVSYMPEYCGFLIYCKSDNLYCWLYNNDFTKIEVIGNIHDNPELLKGEEND